MRVIPTTNMSSNSIDSHSNSQVKMGQNGVDVPTRNICPVVACMMSGRVVDSVTSRGVTFVVSSCMSRRRRSRSRMYYSEWRTTPPT